MSSTRVEQVETIWPSIAEVVHVLRTEADYEEAVVLLDSLIDKVGEDESHPLASLMEILGLLIERYEDEHVAEI